MIFEHSGASGPPGYSYFFVSDSFHALDLLGPFLFSGPSVFLGFTVLTKSSEYFGYTEYFDFLVFKSTKSSGCSGFSASFGP